MLTYRPRKETKQVILHDSHTLPEQSNMEAWLRYNGRKLGLLSIGYHFVLWPDGKFLETRPHHTIGAHTPGFNEDSVGVCLIGGRRVRPGDDGEEIEYACDTFSPEQRATLRWLLQYLSEAYGSMTLKGHSELGNHRHRHQCPSLNMEALRQWLSQS